MFVFYFVRYHSVRTPGCRSGPVRNRKHIFLCTSIPRGGERHMRGCLRGVPAVARLGPLLLLPGWSGRLLRHWIQGNLGLGSLALREVVASFRAWAPSISDLLRRSGLQGGWCWFGCLLSWRRFGATGSRRRAGAFGEELSHRLRRLLSLRETFSEVLHSWSKQATWRVRSAVEGNFIRLFHLRHREPWLALQHDETGHRASNRFGLWRYAEPGPLHFSGPWVRQNPDRHPHWRASWLEKPEAQPSRCSSAWLGWMCRPRLPSDSRGRAEMCGHGLIQRRQMLVSFLFSAINGSESGWSRGADARWIGHAPRFRELVMHIFGKKGDERWRRAWWYPGKKHLSSLLRDGSSPSSLTAFVITRMTSSSAFSLALREAYDGKRAGSATEPDNSSASEATRERLSSSSLSLTPNEITSLAAAEGYWSSWVKRTECSLCDSEACGHWADASSLVTGCSNPLPRCFFLTGPWEEENGRARGAESLSGKKAILEGREARLKLSQWEQSATLSTASVWDFPKHDTHSAWVSSACRGDLHVYNDGAAFATTPFEICSFRGSGDRRRMAAGMTESVSWAYERSNPAAEAFQRRIPASAKSQRRREFVAEEKKSELQWPPP